MIVQELVASLGLEVDEEVFEKFEHIMHKLSHGLLGLGAAFGAAVLGVSLMATETAESGAAVAKLSAQTGVSTEALQGLSFAASVSEASVESLHMGLRHLARSAYEAQNGSQEAKDAFKAVGVTVTDAHGKLKPADELLLEMSNKFHDMPNGMKKSALAMKVFGRGGDELIPLLNKGAEGIEELKARAEELGLVLDEDTIQASEKFVESTKEFQGALTGLRNEIGGPFIHALSEVIDGFTSGIVAVRHWLHETQLLNKAMSGTKWLFRRVFEVVRAATIAIGVAAVAWGILTAVQAVNGIGLGFLISYYGTLGLAAVTSAASAALAWLAAVAPFVLLGTAIVLIYDELYNFVTGGETLLGRLIKWFETNDPTDGGFVHGLKTVGALIFDLTDPAKWKAFFQVIRDVGAWLMDKLGGALIWVGEKLRSLIPAPLLKLLDSGALTGMKVAQGDFKGAAATAIGGAADFVSTPFKGTGGAESPTTSTENSSSANTSNVHDARVFSPQITVNVPPGADAHAIGTATLESLESLDQTKRNEAYVAVNY